MSEKKQRKKPVKTGDGEPTIVVTEEVEGRVTGSSKTLLDDKVHELMAEEESPPPPYSREPEVAGVAGGSGGVGGGSFRGGLAVPGADRQNNKRKSEILTLLEASEACGDDHKPEWMLSHMSSNHRETPRSMFICSS